MTMVCASLHKPVKVARLDVITNYVVAVVMAVVANLIIANSTRTKSMMFGLDKDAGCATVVLNVGIAFVTNLRAQPNHILTRVFYELTKTDTAMFVVVQVRQVAWLDGQMTGVLGGNGASDMWLLQHAVGLVVSRSELINCGTGVGVVAPTIVDR